TVSKTLGAIGYVAVSAATSAVHVVAIDKMQPTPDNVENGRYAFWSYEHMYTRSLPSGAIAAYLNFLLTAPEQKVAANLGYIPINAMHGPTQAPGSSGSSPASSTAASLRKESEQ